MALATGSVLGVYEILGSLGAGGMGEVFRARDTKLGRDVAIKILPESFTHDPERVARFRREAQLLASLNHPNIGAIYGLDEAASTQFLVLELVDGESLASRIERGPLSMADAMSVAADVAHALEVAHEQGIVHRDLKPANIVLTKDGRAKVLDFGLAKAVDAGSNPSQSPSITFAATMMQTQGVILGTAAYMSPEQAKGLGADKRTDVWAFGCVLYEMLTGKRPFGGEDISDTIASVLRDAPDVSALPSPVPAGVRDVIVRCLEKNRRDRIPDVSAARLLLAAAVTAPASTATSLPASARGKSAWLPWSLAAALVVAVIGLAARLLLVAPAAPRTLWIEARLGASARVRADLEGAMALSSDGKLVAFAAIRELRDTSRLYVRRLDEPNARVLPDTDRASDPFFSPDGQWIGFFADRKLKKIAITGGAAFPIADAPSGRGASWADDGNIYFQPVGTTAGTLMKVSSNGGPASPALTRPDSIRTQRWPQVLPGGRDVLYTATPEGAVGGGGFNNGRLVIQSLSGGAPTIALAGGYFGRYVPSGHLLYVHDASLFAVPFDLAKRAVTGSPVTIAEGVAVVEPTGSAQLSVSDAGILTYMSSSTSASADVAWLDQNGATSPLRTTLTAFSNPRFSPDGQRLAMDVAAPVRDLWIYDWARDTASRLTAGPSDNSAPVWSPDGRDIAFSSKRNDERVYNLYVMRADGTGAAERLTSSKGHQIAGSWHPSGKYLAFNEQSRDTAFDLLILPLDGSSATGWKAGTPTVFLRTPAVEQNPEFSPDGQWIAYQSDESGRFEAYVRPFPKGDRKWQVSSAGGTYPVWSPTGHAVFYGTLEGQLMEVPFTVSGETFSPAKPRLWTQTRFGTGLYRRYGLHPDGKRFAIATAATDRGYGDEATLVFNVFEELRRLTAAR